MMELSKEDLPFINSKTLFAAVMYAGRLMGEDGWSMKLASWRAATYYKTDEKLVARYVQNAFMRGSWRQGLPLKWRGIGQQTQQKGQSGAHSQHSAAIENVGRYGAN